MSKLQTTMSSLSYLDQISSHIQEDRKIEQQVLFIYIHQQISMHHLNVLKTKIEHNYRAQYQIQHYSSYQNIIKLNLKLMPVCIILVCYQDRNWAKKFCSNEQLHDGFKLYIVASSEEEYERGQKYNNKNIKTIIFPDSIDKVANEICLLGEKISRKQYLTFEHPIYFQKYSNNRVLTVFITSQLASGFKSQGKKILKSKKYQYVEIQQFKNANDLILKVRSNSQFRRKTKMKIDQLIIEQCQNHKLTAQEQSHLFRKKELEFRNLILMNNDHTDLQTIKDLILNDESRRWQMIVIDERQSYCERIPNSLSDHPFPQDIILELQQMVESDELFIIVHHQDIQTINQVKSLNTLNCYNKLVGFSNPQQLNQIISTIRYKQSAYGIIVISESVYRQFRQVIRSYIDCQNSILNLKILFKEPPVNSKSSLQKTSQNIILGQQQQQKDQIQQQIFGGILVNDNVSILQTVFMQRCNYFHPSSGLEGRKIILLVDYRNSQLVLLAEQISRTNPRRISVEYCSGLEHVKYILSKLKTDEWALLFIFQHNLKEYINSLTFQSQLIVIGSNFKKYPHHKILKQGTPKEIFEFFKLIPCEQSSSIFSYSSLTMYNDSQLAVQTLKRLDFDDHVAQNQQLSNSLISVRLPLDVEYQNTNLLETKLIKHFKQNVVVKYYGTTSEIRDMGNRSQQKTQYLVVNDDYLEWTQEFAKKEINQRFEILLYTYEKVELFERLVTKNSYMRFKLVTNRWSQIQAYITRSCELVLQPEQHLEIVLNQSHKQMERILDSSPILSQTYFRYYDDRKQNSFRETIKQISHKHMIIVIVNQNSADAINERRAIDNIRRYNPSARTLLVSSVRKSKEPRTINSIDSLEQAGEWLKSIRVAEQNRVTRNVNVFKVK